MTIKGLEGKTSNELALDIQSGGKFVVYQYCISILILTFKRSSQVQFIPADESKVRPGLVYSLISLLFGWWGFPWGPIYTFQTIANNFSGGTDVTQAILEQLRVIDESRKE